jgi:hypothetical protein
MLMTPLESTLLYIFAEEVYDDVYVWNALHTLSHFFEKANMPSCLADVKFVMSWLSCLESMDQLSFEFED